eukprot:6718915-Prymnesium_polylepis.1
MFARPVPPGHASGTRNRHDGATRGRVHTYQACVSIVWGRSSAGTGIRPESRPVMGWCAQIVHSDSYYV